jgi:iron complex transport system substrate-binding protein
MAILIAFLVTACSTHVTHSHNPQPAKLPVDECRIVRHAMGKSCILLNPQRIVVTDLLHLAHALALDIKPIAAFGSEEFFNAPFFEDRIKGVELI